jgi:diguanylate cyclase (GGDEF)-like protein/PAS domain S-box-containing protein
MSAQLLESSGEYEALIHFLHIAPVGLVQTDANGEIYMINPLSAQLLMPLCQKGILTNLFTALENVAPDLRHLVASFKKPSGMICDTLRIQLSATIGGKSDPPILSLSMLKLDDYRLMIVLNDVTQQVKRERLLRQNEAWLNAIVTGATEYALVSLDSKGRINDWNESIRRLTGFERDAVIGQPYSIFYPADATTPDRVLDRLHEADESGWSLDDGWRARADGSRFWGSAMIAPLQPPEEDLVATLAGIRLTEPAYCLVIRDITDKREASENVRKATACDHLTGLTNRRTFFETAEIELARWKRSPRPLTLIIFDTDHFKAVNDRYGHPAGDVVLRHMADTLNATFRECDIVARLGGEEFAVLLPSTGMGAALEGANRLLKLIESQVVLADGVEIRYTVSGGIAEMTSDVTGLDALIKRADKSLYAAKNAGRNRVACWT